MRQAISSISVFSRMYNSHFSATTCGARQTAVNPGRCCLAREEEVVATRSGSLSIRRPALGMASNTSQTTALTVAAAAWNFNVLPTAGSPGRRRLIFLIRLYTERSTWTLTATCLSAAKETAGSFASDRALPRSGARHQLLTEAPPLTLVASSVAGESIRQDWMECYSWRLIAPAARLTITFT